MHNFAHTLEAPKNCYILRIIAKRKISKWQFFLFKIGKFKLPPIEYVRIDNALNWHQYCPHFEYNKKLVESVFMRFNGFLVPVNSPYRYYKARIVYDMGVMVDKLSIVYTNDTLPKPPYKIKTVKLNAI